MTDNTTPTTTANIQNAATLFPIGTTARRNIQSALTSSTNAAHTIATYQSEHSLQNLLQRATWNPMSLPEGPDHDSNAGAKAFEPQSVMTFLSHLTEFEVKYHTVHTQLAHRMRRSVEDHIAKLEMTSSMHVQFLLGLLKSVWQVYLNASEDVNVRAVLVAVLKKLGQKNTPKVLLQRLAQRRAQPKQQCAEQVSIVANDFSSWLKHGELFPLLGLPMQRAIFVADFELHASSIFNQPIAMTNEEKSNDEDDSKKLESEKSVSSYNKNQSMPILNEIIMKALEQYKLGDENVNECAQSEGVSKASVLVRSAENSFVNSTRERRVNTQQLRRSNGNKGLKEIKEMIGDDIVMLEAVLGLLVCYHGILMKNGHGIELSTNNILGESRYLHCSLVSDILLSFPCQLPKSYVDLGILAKTLDTCVRDGDVSDHNLAKIQNCLRPLFTASRNDKIKNEQVETKNKGERDNTSIKSSKATLKAKITISKEDREFNEKLMKRVLGAAVAAMRESDPQQLFLNPVTDAIAPGYSRVISKPMCVLNIEKKIDDSLYASLDDFNQDVQTMFNNCILYNIGKEGTWFRTEAKRQNKVFKGMILPQAQSIFKTETGRRRKNLGKGTPNEDDDENEFSHNDVKSKGKKRKATDALAFVDEVKATLKCQKIGMYTNDETREVLTINPLPKMHDIYVTRDELSPSLPSLALMILSDPFVVRILLFKCYQELKKVVNEKQIPLENTKLVSLLQILQAIQFSIKLCALKGKALFIPSPGYEVDIDKSITSGDEVLNETNLSLRNLLPQISKLLLSLTIDKRMAIGGDLHDVSLALQQTHYIPVADEWSSSTRLCIVIALLKYALIDLLRPGQTNEHAFISQLDRFKNIFVAQNSSPQLVNERSFWLSLANTLLSYKAKFPHKMRDSLIDFWLFILKKARDTSLFSASHEIAIRLLNEWSVFGNAVVPVDLRLKLSKEFAMSVSCTRKKSDLGSVQIDFAQAWSEYSKNSTGEFSRIRCEYDRLLQGLPANRVITWKQSLRIA